MRGQNKIYLYDSGPNFTFSNGHQIILKLVVGEFSVAVQRPVYQRTVLETGFRGYKNGREDKTITIFVSPEGTKARANKNGINLMIFLYS